MTKSAEYTAVLILLSISFMIGFSIGAEKQKHIDDKAVRKVIDAQIIRSHITEEHASDDYKPYPAYYLLEVKKELNIMGGHQ